MRGEADSSLWVPQFEVGQIRALCIRSAERVPCQSGAPTLQELGRDMVVTSPFGVSGPRGMDSGVVPVLHDAIKAALFSPVNTAVCGRFDMPEQCLDSEGYAVLVPRRAEYERAAVQRLGLKLDRSASDPGWT